MYYFIHLEDSTLVCLTFDSQFWRYRTNFVHYENPHWLDIDESFNKCQQWWACSCLTVQSTQMTLSQRHVPLSQDMISQWLYRTLEYHNGTIHTQSSSLWHCITTESYHILSLLQINSPQLTTTPLVTISMFWSSTTNSWHNTNLSKRSLLMTRDSIVFLSEAQASTMPQW